MGALTLTYLVITKCPLRNCVTNSEIQITSNILDLDFILQNIELGYTKCAWISMYRITLSLSHVYLSAEKRSYNRAKFIIWNKHEVVTSSSLLDSSDSSWMSTSSPIVRIKSIFVIKRACMSLFCNVPASCFNFFFYKLIKRSLFGTVVIFVEWDFPRCSKPALWWRELLKM